MSTLHHLIPHPPLQAELFSVVSYVGLKVSLHPPGTGYAEYVGDMGWRIHGGVRPYEVSRIHRTSGIRRRYHVVGDMGVVASRWYIM